MVKMEVYELTRNYDPRFDGFDFAGRAKSLLGNSLIHCDFEPTSYTNADWKPSRLSKLWKPQKVERKVRPFNDFPCIGTNIPVFSKRAVDSLKDLLEADGEILELASELGQFFAFNVLTKLDALDLGKSKGYLFDGHDCFQEITEFAFKPKVLGGHSIFRLSHFPKSILVTSTFKSRVEQSGLNGMDFIKLWPFPKGVSWERENIKRLKTIRKSQAKLYGQGLIIKLKSEQPKASPAELKSAEMLANKLRSKIADEMSLYSTYWGCLEMVESSRGWIQIEFTCPDCSLLLKKLLDTKLIKWPGKTVVVKVLGNLFDSDSETMDLSLSE